MSEAVPQPSVGQVAERTGSIVPAPRRHERRGIFAGTPVTTASMWPIHIAAQGRHVDAGDVMTIVGRQ